MNPTNTDDRIDELTADAAQDTAKAWTDRWPSSSAIGGKQALAEQIERERTMMQLQPPPPKTYPSFYAAVHRAWNAEIAQFSGAIDCIADAERYEPDEHMCYGLAASIRVELHAAGIRLSNNGNGSAFTPYTGQPANEEQLRRVIADGETLMAWVDPGTIEAHGSTDGLLRRVWRLVSGPH